MNGETVRGQDGIPDIFNNHFSSNLGTGNVSSLTMERLQEFVMKTLNDNKKQRLMSDITNQEIKESTFDIDVNTSLGPYGFNSHFYKECWGYSD